MKLIMTDAEKKAATWAELDDAALGKVVKANMFVLKHVSEEQQKLFFMSAAIILCSSAAEANADRLTQTIKGLTVKGKPFGNWKVVIKRVNPSPAGS